MKQSMPIVNSVLGRYPNV